MRGNDVRFAFIQGKAVDLDNHQKALGINTVLKLNND